MLQKRYIIINMYGTTKLVNFKKRVNVDCKAQLGATILQVPTNHTSLLIARRRRTMKLKTIEYETYKSIEHRCNVIYKFTKCQPAPEHGNNIMLITAYRTQRFKP